MLAYEPIVIRFVDQGQVLEASSGFARRHASTIVCASHRAVVNTMLRYSTGP